MSIIFTGWGTEAAPITLRAAKPGQTLLTGRSTLRLAGLHLVVEGLHFKDPDPAIGDLIQFRVDSKKTAQHCRMSGCAVSSTAKSDAAQESRWVGLYGADNVVEHCAFSGKSGKGTTCVVWLGKGNEGRHRIARNYFGPRERLGQNGGETLRIGDSKTSMQTASCVVEQNLFEKCNGEAECISNKSCGNIYRENTFLEVSGTLTLRHGNGCLVERNIFLGNKAKGTGGIRIIGEDHIVRGNHLKQLSGDDARSAITLMMGIPDSPLHRYFQVKRARIEDNIVEDCDHPILIGLEDDKKATLAPVETVFENNRILSQEHPAIEARCALDGINWKANILAGPNAGIPLAHGISHGEVQPAPVQPLTRAEVGPGWYR